MNCSALCFRRMEDIQYNLIYWNMYLDRLRNYRRILNTIITSLSLGGVGSWLVGLLPPSLNAGIIVLMQVASIYPLTCELDRKIEVVSSVMPEYNELQISVESIWIKIMTGTMSESSMRRHYRKLNKKYIKTQSMLDATSLPLKQNLWNKAIQRSEAYLKRFHEQSPTTGKK